MRKRWLVTTLVVLAVPLAVSAGAAASPSDGFKALKAVSARYHSVDQAISDGYSGAGEPCVASPDGTMGIHYVNGSLTADLALDPLRPEILLYVPKDDGEVELVGVEYFVVALANTSEGPAPWFGDRRPPLGFFNPPPSILGRTLEGPMAGHNPEMPWHYDLHVWVWEANPSGTFATFNPAISC